LEEDNKLDYLLSGGMTLDQIGKYQDHQGIGVDELYDAIKAGAEPDEFTDDFIPPNKPEPPEDVFSDFNFYSVNKLTEDERRPPDFVVDGMIPVGLTFISGAPKIHKSFMALQLAEAVATGSDFLGHKTMKCSVAYLDLEGSKSRTAVRTARMGVELSDKVFITHRVKKRIADGLIDELRKLHHQHPDIRLIIIDTYSCARGQVKSVGANAYDSDVAILEPVQQMAVEENIAIVFVHHDKKGAGMAKDVFERISGTMGISGSADSVLTLVVDGKRTDGRAHLEFTPRDARGGEMDLLFDEYRMQWSVNDTTEPDVLGSPIVSWCYDHAPDSNVAAEFFPYDAISQEAYGTYIENPGEKVRNEIQKAKDDLYTVYGVAVQTGVKSNGKRGIRLMRCATIRN